MKRGAVDPQDKALLMGIVRDNIVARGGKAAGDPGRSQSPALPLPSPGGAAQDAAQQGEEPAASDQQAGGGTEEGGLGLPGGVLGLDGLPSQSKARRAAPKVAARRGGARASAGDQAAAAAAEQAAAAAAAEAEMAQGQGYDEEVYAY